MENWVNSGNNPKGVGNAPGVTEILFGVTLTGEVTSSKLYNLYSNKAQQDWTLIITDGEGKTEERHIAPASTFQTTSSNYFFRFEPCLAADLFVPEPGTKYKIDLKIETSDTVYYVTGDGNGYMLSTFPVDANGEYYDASAFVEFPVALTVAPIYDQIENTYGKTWFVVSVNAGKINDLFYSRCKDGTLRLEVTVRDETDGITYVIDRYYFDDPNGYETYSTSFMRFAPCEYGFSPVLGHAYTLTLRGYAGEELQYEGASAEGAFARTNAAFASNGPIVPDTPAHGSTVIPDAPDYDVDCDGELSIGDVSALLDLLSMGLYDAKGDLDGSGFLNIEDVSALLDVLASRS